MAFKLLVISGTMKFKNITSQLYLFQVRGTSSLDFYVAEI